MVKKVRIEKEKLKTCLTCPICNNLFERATTISECLHTFCRNCIQDKITEGDLDTCPVCNTSLGCSPLEKLRPDNSLLDLRLKLFPPKRKNVEAATETTAAPLAASRKKEKSLSSLVANSPVVSSSKSTPALEKDHVPYKSDVPVVRKTSKMGEGIPRIKSLARASPKSRAGRRRSKPRPGKNDVLLETDMLIEEKPKRKEENDPEICSSSKILTDIAEDHGQNSAAVPPEGDMQKKNTEEDSEKFPKISDLWKPLNCLAELAGQSKTSKANEQETIGISQLCNARKDDAQIINTMDLDQNSMRNNGSEQMISEPAVPPTPTGQADGDCTPHPNPDDDATKASGDNPKESKDENHSSPPQLRPRRHRKLNQVASQSAATNVEANGKVEGRNVPVWFSLIASENQGTNASLPQISSCYLRVKDSNLPVSHIKKYLVKKLSLANEAEVEITVRGQPLVSSLRLHSLVEWWVATTPSSEQISSSVGSSAKDFVMVLSYARKSRP